MHTSSLLPDNQGVIQCCARHRGASVFTPFQVPEEHHYGKYVDLLGENLFCSSQIRSQISSICFCYKPDRALFQRWRRATSHTGVFRPSPHKGSLQPYAPLIGRNIFAEPCAMSRLLRPFEPRLLRQQRRHGHCRVEEGRPGESSDCRRQCARLGSAKSRNVKDRRWFRPCGISVPPQRMPTAHPWAKVSQRC